MQVNCKSVRLIAFALPHLHAGGFGTVPMGIAASFLFIVLTYPFAIVRLISRTG